MGASALFLVEYVPVAPGSEKLVSLAFTSTLTFVLAPVYIGAIILTAIVLAQVTGDGEATQFEGWALVAIYAIVAVVALYE